VVVPALQKEHELRRGGKGKKVLGRDDIEVFKRKWICNYRLQVSRFRIVVDSSVFQITTVTVKLGLRRGRWEVCMPELCIINVCAKLCLVDHIITFMREGNQDYGCDVYE
jgi:cyclopropane-fatty-acyl-phospholipid synthase